MFLTLADLVAWASNHPEHLNKTIMLKVRGGQAEAENIEGRDSSVLIESSQPKVAWKARAPRPLRVTAGMPEHHEIPTKKAIEGWDIPLLPRKEL